MSRITWKKTHGYAMAYTQNTNQHSKVRHKIKCMKMQNYSKLLILKTKHNPSIYLLQHAPRSYGSHDLDCLLPLALRPRGTKGVRIMWGFLLSTSIGANVATGLSPVRSAAGCRRLLLGWVLFRRQGNLQVIIWIWLRGSCGP